MGTSNSNPGPGSPGPLLPPGAPPPPPPLPDPDEEQEDDQDDPSSENAVPLPIPGPRSWANTKGDLGNYARTGNRTALRTAGRGFVRSQGGSRGATLGSTSGISTARNLGGVLSGFSSQGVSTTVQRFNLRYVGQNVNALLNALVDAIAPAGSYDEDVVSRLAAAETLQTLFEQYEVAEKGLDAFENLTLEAIRETLGAFITNYITRRFMSLLGQKIEQKSVTPEDAYACELDVKEYIVERVKLEFTDGNIEAVSWDSSQGQQLVEGIFKEAYSLLEDGE